MKQNVTGKIQNRLKNLLTVFLVFFFLTSFVKEEHVLSYMIMGTVITSERISVGMYPGYGFSALCLPAEYCLFTSPHSSLG